MSGDFTYIQVCCHTSIRTKKEATRKRIASFRVLDATLLTGQE